MNNWALRSVFSSRAQIRSLFAMSLRASHSGLSAKFKIHHNKDLNRFEMPLNAENGDEDAVAFVEYIKENNTYDLTESVVPESLQGNGLGKILARLTFEDIIKQNGKLKLTCDFLKHFYTQNQEEFKNYVVEY